jgi:acetyl esterase
MSRTIAAVSGATVLTVDYPLAPEAPFPAALNQLEAFVDALGREGGSLGLDASRFAVVGDSAGANLAVALALKLRDRKAALPRALGLFYGAYDSDLERPSYARFGDGSLPLSLARMRWFWGNYVPDPAERKAPLVAPIHADLRGLPPSFLAIADHDVLHDENIAFVDRLRESGCAAELRVYAGTVHGFAEADGAVGAPIAGRAIHDVAAFLAAELNAGEA